MQTNEKMHTWSWLKIKQKNKNYCQPAFFVRMNNLKIIVLCKERNSKKSFFGIHLIIIITCFRFIWLLLPFHICYLILKHKLSFIVHFIHQYHLKAKVLPQKIPSKNETCHIRIKASCKTYHTKHIIRLYNVMPKILIDLMSFLLYKSDDELKR